MNYSLNRPKLLAIVKSEELARRLISYNEIIKLSNIFLNQVKNYPSTKLQQLKEQLLSSFTEDNRLIDLINNIAKINADQYPVSFSMATNRVKFILNQAETILQNNFSDITSKHFLELYLANLGKLSPEDTKVTAWPNYYQTLLLKALALIHNQKITELEVLKTNNIYQLEFSPNLSSTGLSIAFAEQPSEIIQQLQTWNFFHRDENSPPQGELLLPNLGYIFGGVREDQRYLDKPFRPEDCSSAIEKWLDLKDGEFSTLVMALIAIREYKKLQAYPTVPADIEEYILAAESVLIPLPSGIAPEPGMLFAFRNFNLKEDPHKNFVMATKGGHTGIVVQTTKNGFLSLTYKRNLEEENVEGLILQEEIMEPGSARTYYFFDAKSVADDKYTEILLKYQEEGNFCPEITNSLNQCELNTLL